MPVLRLSSGTRVDLDRLQIARDGAVLPLTAQEAALLGRLAEQPGQVVSRDQLLTEVWGYKKGLETRAIDNAVKRLRAKLEREPAEPQHLVTVFGVGYLLEGLVTAPEPATGLVGREDDLAALASALAGSALVTLWGPGGVGKTSLARAMLQDREGFFVDCAAAEQAHDALRVTAQVLGVHGQGGGAEALAAQIGVALAARGAPLLVLDNVEQIPDLLPHLLRWAEGAPSARTLLTSRIRLGEELAVALAPLGEADARTLFRARAPAGWEAPEDALAAVLARLDGLPLAIELAAARASLLSAPELARRLESDLRLLTRRDGSGPDRHASLAAVVDWSWALLPGWQQEALAQLSVFRGGADLEAVEAVLALPEGRLALDAVEALAEASLLRIQRSDAGPARVLLLQAVSEAVGRHLSPEQRAAAEARHLAHYLPLARAWGADALHMPAHVENLAREADNLLAIQRRAAAHAPDAAAEVALALDALWTVRGPLSARRAVLEAAQASPPLSPALRARLHLAVAGVLYMDRRYAAAEAEIAAGRAVAPEDPVLRSRLLRWDGQLQLLRGAPEPALATLREAARVADPTTRAAAEAEIFRVSWSMGALDEAERAAEAALTDARAGGARWTEAWVLERLGRLHAERGELALAIHRVQEAIAIWRALGKANLGANLYHLGVIQQLRWCEADLRLALQGARPPDAPTYDLAASAALLREVATDHGRAGQALDRAVALSTLWGVLHRQSSTESSGVIREALSTSERHGAARFVAWFGTMDAVDRALDGDVALAEALGRRAVAALGEHLTQAPLAQVLAAALALGRGERAEATARLGALGADDRLIDGVRHGVVWSACEVLLTALDRR